MIAISMSVLTPEKLPLRAYLGEPIVRPIRSWTSPSRRASRFSRAQRRAAILATCSLLNQFTSVLISLWTEFMAIPASHPIPIERYPFSCVGVHRPMDKASRAFRLLVSLDARRWSSASHPHSPCSGPHSAEKSLAAGSVQLKSPPARFSLIVRMIFVRKVCNFSGSCASCRRPPPHETRRPHFGN